MGTLEIDEEIYTKAKKIAEFNGYDTLEKMVESILKDAIRQSESREATDKDKEKMKEKLKELGYLD